MSGLITNYLSVGLAASRPVTPTISTGGIALYLASDTGAFSVWGGSWATLGAGSVTSITGSGGTTGLTLGGGPITTSGTLTLSGTLGVANGGTGATTAGAALTNLGATTVGGSVVTLANPSAITFLRVNADNSVSALSASAFRTAIGAGTGTGTGDMIAANNLSDVLSIVGSIDNLFTKGADIASASTTNLASATGNFVDVTGTTTITALGTSAAGVERTVRFTGILTLTYNATSLILPSAANITTAAGDVARFRSLGSGNWVCVAYQRASGQALALPLATASDIRTGTNATKPIASDQLMAALAAQTLTDGATISWNLASGFNAKVTIAGNRTLSAPTNMFEGMTAVLQVIQDATGSRTMTWPGAFDWGSSGTPTLSTAAAKIDIVTLYCYDASTPKFRAVFSKAA